MRVRAATLDDAPAMGRVMVDAWLSAHRGQVPEPVWRKRVEEWTPEVSAAAWARLLVEQARGTAARAVVLVAEEPGEGGLVALVLGDEDVEDATGSTAQIGALYVREDRRGRGIGRALLRAAAGELAGHGFSRLRVGVLTSNRPARAFYEAMGGQEIERRAFDEEGVPLPGTVYGWQSLADCGAGQRIVVR